MRPSNNMDVFRRTARDWLYNCTRSEFYEVMHEAKITPRQFAICKSRFVDGLLNYQIGIKMNISDKTVERDVAKAYDALLKVLWFRIVKSPWSVRVYRILQGLLFFTNRKTVTKRHGFLLHKE